MNDIIVRLEGKEIDPINLTGGYYFYKFDEQEMYAVPRIIQEQIPQVLKRAKKEGRKIIDLQTANLPFLPQYDKASKMEKIGEAN